MGPEVHLEPIPRPPGHMLVGNLLDIDAAHPIESLVELAREYGPIFELAVPGGSRFVVSGFELVDELCDESRFDKKVAGGLTSLARGPAGRGLFTSETQDPDWRRAHNVLLPAFSMDAMRGYYPRMLDIAVQLMQKWERLNPDDTGQCAGRHDAAHSGYDRAVRLQLQVQLLLSRHAPSLRRRHAGLA